MFASLFRWLRGHLRRPVGLALAAAVPTLLLLAWYWYENTTDSPREILLQRGETFLGDLMRKHGRHAALRSDLVFIGLDDASLSLDGLWPDEIEKSPALKLISQAKGAWNWSREVHALLLDRLMEAGARLVVFDMVFPLPNTGDDAFRAALDRHRDRVIIGAQIIEESGGGTFQPPAATLIADPRHDPRVGYLSYRGDAIDNVIRSLWFTTTQETYFGRRPHVGDTVYPSLLTSVLRQLGRADLIPADGRQRWFRYTNLRFDAQNRRIADYLPHPLWEIFSEATWKQNYQDGLLLKDKIIIVGATAPTLHDFQLTPYGQIPGPDLHLQVMTAALGEEYLTRTSLLTNLAMIVVSGVLAWAVGLFVHAPLVRLISLVLVSTMFAVALRWLYNGEGLMPLAFAPLLTFNVGGLTGLIGEYAVERFEKARVRGVLDRLVSKDIVRELLHDRDRYDQLVRGQRRAVTVLFSDVRGFTTLTEQAKDPAALVTQLNEYLGEMVDIVFRHRGTLDKFIGDAVMAVWGSIHTDGVVDDARQAVAAALEMRTRLAALNARWTAEGKMNLAIGVGVNHGEAIVGGLGSEKSKMEITVMGDAVNTASRLEGLTKEYDLDLLVGESVAAKVSETFRLRTVDRVQVKGKKRPTEVMTVLGPLTEMLPMEREELLADYEDAILLYRRRDFAGAARTLESCLRVDPADGLTTLYLTRCQECLAQAPAESWEAVRLMTTK